MAIHQQFQGSAGRAIVDEVKTLFGSDDIFFSLRRHLSFVCGGNDTKKYRPAFIDYVNANGSPVNILKAEDAVASLLAHSAPAFVNLADFEELIGDLVDSILIFPESPGSIAELAYFAKTERLAKKTLVANDVNNQEDSFINLGPIALINRCSDYRPTFFLNATAPNFKNLLEQLRRFDNKRKQRDRFELDQCAKLGNREQFAAIFTLVKIFPGIDFEGVCYCIRRIFGRVEKKQTRRLMSILQAASYLERFGPNSENIQTRADQDSLLDFDRADINGMSARALQYFQEHHTATYAIVTELNSDD